MSRICPTTLTNRPLSLVRMFALWAPCALTAFGCAVELERPRPAEEQSSASNPIDAPRNDDDGGAPNGNRDRMVMTNEEHGQGSYVTDPTVDVGTMGGGGIEETTDADLGFQEDNSKEPEGLCVAVHIRDTWGRTVPGTSVKMKPSLIEEVSLGGESCYLLEANTGYRFELGARDHRGAHLTLDYDGTLEADGVQIDRGHDTRFGLAYRYGSPMFEGRARALHLYVGLPHKWFATSGAPVRRGGEIQFLMDGEEAWSTVHTDLDAAEDTIHLSTWWWDSDFELTRSAPMNDIEERETNTVMSVFERSPATKRVVFWDSPILWRLSTDDRLREHGNARDDFEVLGIKNETQGRFEWSMPNVDFGERLAAHDVELDGRLTTPGEIQFEIADRTVDLDELPFLERPIPHASYHQKFVVIDEDVAFVGGMNLRPTDWDTVQHDLYDPRRMNFDATQDEREAVMNGERDTDTPPRKDYMLRLTGPIVQDVSRSFGQLWNDNVDKGSRFAENASLVEPPAFVGDEEAGVAMQLVRTLPAPYHDYSILETHLNAVSQATKYILVEDQYWRAPILVEAIKARMDAVPGLHLLVVTNDISEWTDPGCLWTAVTHQELLERFPGRYHYARLTTFGRTQFGIADGVRGRFADLVIHSKLLLIDDVFMTVGSCNTNNRGFLYEYEMNVNVFDSTTVTEIRREVVSNLLGTQEISDHHLDWIQAFDETVEHNANVETWWRSRDGMSLSDGLPLPEFAQPKGFLFPLEIRAADRCFFQGVGADVTGH